MTLTPMRAGERTRLTMPLTPVVQGGTLALFVATLICIRASADLPAVPVPATPVTAEAHERDTQTCHAWVFGCRPAPDAATVGRMAAWIKEHPRDGEALYYMFNMYFRLLVYDADDPMAAYCPELGDILKRSAECGFVPAKVTYATCLLTDAGSELGIPQDYARGKKLLDESLASGCPLADRFKGVLLWGGVGGYARDLAQAKLSAENALLGGDVCAHYVMGYILTEMGDAEGALSSFRQGASAGDPSAQYCLAHLLLQEHTKKAAAEAFQWLLKSVESDRSKPDTFALLGQCYSEGIGTSHDEAAAYRNYLWASRLIHPESIAQVGMRELLGVGCDANVKSALSKLERASQMGVNHASLYLAGTYLEGLLVPRDVDRAEQFFRLAQEQGNTAAAQHVRWIELTRKHGLPLRSLKRPATRPTTGTVSLPEPKTAVTRAERDRDVAALRTWWHAGVPIPDFDALCRSAAWLKSNPNDAETLFFLSRACMRYVPQDDIDPSKVNPADLTEMLRRSAELGFLPARAMYASALMDGCDASDVAVDSDRGYRMLEECIKAKSPDAYVCRGWLFVQGVSPFRHNLELAERDFRRAADLGDSAGQVGIATTQFLRGNIEGAAESLRPLAAQGVSSAKRRLAMLNLDRPDRTAAQLADGIRLLKLAAEASNGPALTKLGECYEGGIGVPRDAAMAFKYYSKAWEFRDGGAAYHLAMMKLEAAEEPADVQVALRYLEAAMHEVDSARVRLAAIYVQGLFVDRDIPKAKDLLQNVDARSLDGESRVLMGRLQRSIEIRDAHSRWPGSVQRVQ
ncbi:MAG: tetratricopeptide repeat protein [Tepidisphaerales bacterium]